MLAMALAKKYRNEDERGADGDSVIDDLRESFAKLGPIRPALVTKFGVAAGETRKKANPAWPEQVVNVKSFYDHLRLRAADNIHARKPVVWWTALLGEAGEELMKSGVKPGRITERLMQDFPLAERTILAYLPRKYKSTARVRAGSLGGFAASNAAVAAATTALNDTTAKTVAEGPTSESGQERNHSDRPRHERNQSQEKLINHAKAETHNQALGNLLEQTKKEMSGTVDAKLAVVKEEITKSVGTQLQKIQLTVDQALTKPPNGEAGSIVSNETVVVDMPGNNINVAISPMTQVYYAVAKQKLQELYPDHEVGSLSEFINDCVRDWFEGHGFHIGIVDSSSRRLEFRSGSP